jgi:hypothetical protein
MFYLASKYRFFPCTNDAVVVACSSTLLRMWHNSGWTRSPVPDEMAQTNTVRTYPFRKRNTGSKFLANYAQLRDSTQID